MSGSTPVVVIAFNRPELTARLVDALRKVQPERLFVVADGPRPDRPDDARLTGAVRRLFDELDWPARVERRFADGNLGCEATVELGLDWVFGQVDRAIVLEDDCIPDPSFFDYCDELLERYAGDPRVWQIAGNSHEVPPVRFGGDSYAFSSWASVWGWATWADRWQRHRELFPRDHAVRPAAPVRTEAPRIPPGALVTRGGRRHFAEAATSTDVVTHGWDKHWWISIIGAGGLAATPAVNLVENAGFGADATHGVSDRTTEPARPMTFPLRHPAAVALNADVERELELLLNRVGGPAARIARRLVRSPKLRRLLRGAVNSRLAVAAARTLSRATSRWIGKPR